MGQQQEDQGLEGVDPEDAEADQPEVRDLVQQVAREEEEQDEGYSKCKEPCIFHWKIHNYNELY